MPKKKKIPKSEKKKANGRDPQDIARVFVEDVKEHLLKQKER